MRSSVVSSLPAWGSCARALRVGAGLACMLVAGAVARAQVSLYTVVDLARRNSTAVRQAQADVVRAQAGVAETRDVYVPSLVVGSSAGYSYGFPVGQPTIFNAQVQSLVVSFSQPDYIRSARAALHTATLRLEDALEQAELDTSLDYAQLSTITQQLGALREQKSYTERLHAIEQDRLNAGVESEIVATRAELVGAQADLRRLDLEAQASVLRERLANETGLFADTMQAEPETIPAGSAEALQGVRRTVASVYASYSNAVSKNYVAHGDQRQSYRPQIGFGFNYQLFDTNVNNYNNYYKQPLQANNFSAGVQISLPLFDAVRSAHARGSAAEAVRASLDAEQAREQANEQVVQLERSLVTLRAQARVAELQWQLSGQQLKAVLLETENPPTAPGAAPLTPRDEMEARIAERARFSDVLDARFALLKGQLSLLRTTRQLSAWVNHGAR